MVYRGTAIRAGISLARHAEVMVIRKTNFIVRVWRGNEARGSKGGAVRVPSTKSRLHKGEEVARVGGFRFIRPLRNLLVRGWVNNNVPSIGCQKDVNAARWTLRNAKANPLCFRCIT